ncbi:MAG: hypothetical protein RLZZ253_782 [Verrucomicrobiota bacterium]
MNCLWRFLGILVGMWGMGLPGGGTVLRAEAVSEERRVSEWLSDLEKRFEQVYRDRVVEQHRKGVVEAREMYLEQVQYGLSDAERVGDQRDASVFRQELEALKSEDWQMPSTDEDTTLEYLRRARRNYREMMVQLNRDWEMAARQVRVEFDAALVQGVRQLSARNLAHEVSRVQAARRDLMSVWMPRMLSLRPPALDAAKIRGGDPGEGRERAGNRRALVAAVKWVLEGSGEVTIFHGGKTVTLERETALPQGRVDFLAVTLDRAKFGRPLFPGELQHLARFRSVRHLGLLGFDNAPEEFSFLSELRQLRRFVLRGGRVNARVGAWLSQCSQLCHLEITGCQGLTAEFFRELGTGLSHLRSLDLKNSALEDSVAQEIAVHNTLTELHLDHTGLSSKSLPALSGLRSLRELTLFEGPWEGLEHLKGLPLRSLRKVAEIGRCFPKLQALGMAGKGLTAEQARSLARHFKKCVKVDFSGILPDPGALKVLADLSHLEEVCFRSSRLGDDLLAEMMQIRNLKSLDLAHTGVTDSGLQGIADGRMRELIWLNLRQTRVSSEFGMALRNRFPRLTVLLD